MRLLVLTWLWRRVMRRKAGRYASVSEAVAALRKQGIVVTPYTTDFQHWQRGDFIMEDADVIRYAISMGVIDR